MKDKDLSEIPNTQDTKVCTKCLRNLTISSFYRWSTGKHAPRSECKDCLKQRYSIYKKTEKGRSVCNALGRKYAHTDKVREYKRNHANRPESKELKRIYSQTEKVKRRRATYGKSEKGKIVRARYGKKYRKSELGKASQLRSQYKRRGVISTLTSMEWEVIKKRYKQKCVYCGEKKPLTRDCLIPVSKGGGYTKENVVPACKSCNSTKSNKPILLQLLAMDKPKTSYSA